MNKADALARILFLVAGIPFLYFLLTKKEPNWIYYTSLSLIIAGLVYNLFSDWKAGRKQRVKQRLVIYSIFIVLFLILTLVK